MKPLDCAESRDWLRERRLSFDAYGDGFSPVPKCPAAEGVEVEVGTYLPPLRLRALMRAVALWGLATLEFPSGEVLHFPSCDTLIMIQDWDVDVNDHPAYVRAVQLLLRWHPGKTGDALPRGLSFTSDEPLDVAVFSMIPLFALWDAYIVPAHGNFFLFTHDEEMHVVAARMADISGVIAALDSAEFEYNVRPISTRFLLNGITKESETGK